MPHHFYRMAVNHTLDACAHQTEKTARIHIPMPRYPMLRALPPYHTIMTVHRPNEFWSIQNTLPSSFSSFFPKNLHSEALNYTTFFPAPEMSANQSTPCLCICCFDFLLLLLYDSIEGRVGVIYPRMVFVSCVSGGWADRGIWRSITFPLS